MARIAVPIARLGCHLPNASLHESWSSSADPIIPVPPGAHSSTCRALASFKDADEAAIAGKGTSVLYDYNAEGERTTTPEAIADSHTRTTVTTRSVVQYTGGSGNNPPIPNDT